MIKPAMMASLVAFTAMSTLAQSVTPQNPTEPRIGFVKIDVNDLDAAARSYSQAFQMQDIGRIHNKTPLVDEATLKFGDSADRARAGDTTGIVLVAVPGRKPLHGFPDKTPAVVLTVPNVEATIARARAAGFSVVQPAKDTGGFSVGMVADVSGNVIEMIHLL